MTAKAVRDLADLQRLPPRADHYDLQMSSFPDGTTRPLIPFAVPYDCAHVGDEMGIVHGTTTGLE